MDGHTHRYLDLAARPEIGAVLLDGRPALIFSADGSRALLANAAGALLIGDAHLGVLLERRFTDLNPLKSQLSRLARVLPSESDRIEMLRFGRGVQMTTIAAACRRLNLPDNDRAVLAVGTNPLTQLPLSARAEALVDMIGDRDRLAAVLSADDGRVLAASGGFDVLMPSEPQIDSLIDTALHSRDAATKQFLVSSKRAAGAVRFRSDGRDLLLVLVGPARTQASAPAETPAPSAQKKNAPDILETPIEVILPELALDAVDVPELRALAEAQAKADAAERRAARKAATEKKTEAPQSVPVEATGDDAAPTEADDEPAPAPESSPVQEPSDDDEPAQAMEPATAEAPPVATNDHPAPDAEESSDATSQGDELSSSTPVVFTWALDATGRFTFISPELTESVGAANGSVGARTWENVADILGLDPDRTVADAIAVGRDFAVRVFWPDAHAGDRVAVDLMAVAARSASGTAFRGFGRIVADDRRPDDRAEKTGLDTVVPVFAVPEQEADDSEPAAPSPSEPGDDLDIAAQKSIEQGGATAATARPMATPSQKAAQPASNVVRLPGRAPPEKLTGSERDAFLRIAEALGHPDPREAIPASAETTAADDAETEQAESDAEAAAASVVRAPAVVEAPAPTPDIDTRVLDRLPVGIAIFRDHKTLFANRSLIDLLGYDTLDAFVDAGGADAIFPGSGLADSLAGTGGRLTARRKDGSSVLVTVWLHAITFAGSTALMLSLLAGREQSGDSEDETVRELGRSEARAEELAAILDTATDGVIVVDGRGRIGSMNRAAEALFGVNGPEYTGRYITDLLADESHKAALDYLDGLAENGVASVLNDGREVIGRVPNGGLIPLFMTMGRIGDKTGGGAKFAAVLRDITHWKNVEAELIAARRSAEAANAQKSDFLAKISHEIRTPLNAIIGFSEVMMEERFGPIGSDRYRDYLRDIHVSGAHLMSLINDLLDLSKIEAGKLDLAFEAVPVNAMIQECVALMQPQANRERIIIRTSLAAELPSVVADPRSVRQILLNLMSNAVKFTRAGGQVILSTTLETNGEVVVHIRDTGIGMTEKDIETALKPFRQVATAAGDREHGTGLGLPLTKALVEANRAAFAIESAPNQGTLVRITFPTTRVLAG